MTTNCKTYTVSEHDMQDIFNMLTYDYYASLQRRLWRAGFKRRPFFIEYVSECKQHMNLDSISADAWHNGYMFVADLFEDNERFGTPCDKEAMLDQSIDEVVRMLTRNHR